MYINLTDAELSIIMYALNTALEDRESESRCTDADDILEANTGAINEMTTLIENLQSQAENPVNRLSVAVKVQGGMVHAVYSNSNVDVDVYDLDVYDFPDEGEEDEASLKEKELNELCNTPGWREVW